MIYASTTFNSPPTTIQPRTIPPIINTCLPRLGARHSIAAFFASYFFPQHLNVGVGRPAAPADAPQTLQALPSYQVILALDQTLSVHQGPTGDEGIFPSPAGVLLTGNPRPLHHGIWRVPQGVRLRPALSSILFNVFASSSLPQLRPASGQDPLLAPSPHVCILPQCPAAKQPLGVRLRPHICMAAPSRPSLTTLGPQDFTVL